MANRLTRDTVAEERPQGRVSKGGQRQTGGPSFETHRCAMLLRVR